MLRIPHPHPHTDPAHPLPTAEPLNEAGAVDNQPHNPDGIDQRHQVEDKVRDGEELGRTAQANQVVLGVRRLLKHNRGGDDDGRRDKQAQRLLVDDVRDIAAAPGHNQGDGLGDDRRDQSQGDDGNEQEGQGAELPL